MPRRIKSAENGEPTQGFERNRKPSAVKGLNNGNNNNNKRSAVHRLYELCVETFSPPGTVPSPEAIENLRSFLDTIKPVDVGLKEVVSIQDSGNDLVKRPNMRKGQCSGSKRAGFAPPITYVHVYECDSFSIGIFCLPPSAVLPLHNHPGMTVLSKLLYGSMHLKSYDCVNPTDTEISTCPPQGECYTWYSLATLAKTKVNTIYKAPCESSVLSPRTGGNIHSLTAVTSCAVLDVLAPPYSDKDGRHCTYYRGHPCSGLPGNSSPFSNPLEVCLIFLGYIVDICSGHFAVLADTEVTWFVFMFKFEFCDNGIWKKITSAKVRIKIAIKFEKTHNLKFSKSKNLHDKFQALANYI